MSYRVVTDDEFWRSCEAVIQEGLDEGLADDRDEMREKFLKIYTAACPPAGSA